MTRSIQACAGNEIFAYPGTRDAMFDWLPSHSDRLDHGLGLPCIKGKTRTVWVHLGVGQAFMFCWPDGDVTLCGTRTSRRGKAVPSCPWY